MTGFSNSKYDTIGIGYNNTRKADSYLTSRLLALLAPESGKEYLDIGCGTGNYTIALQKAGVSITGIDPSMEMLTTARSKSSEIEWIQASCEKIPADNESFDGAIATLTIHHWADLPAGLREVARVLRPGARLIIFTSAPEQMEGYWVRHYFPTLMTRSIHQMPSLQVIGKALNDAGLSMAGTEKYFVDNSLEDLFLQAGKHRPALYLDEKVRAGISSFASLANREEVSSGLEKLEADIASGAIDAVISQYESNTGDYVFIVTEKRRE